MSNAMSARNFDPVFLYGCDDPIPVNIGCASCGYVTRIHVNRQDLAEWHSTERRNISQVFPYLATPERELFLSGMCRECWKREFGAEDTSSEYTDAFAEGRSDGQLIADGLRAGVRCDPQRGARAVERYLESVNHPHPLSGHAGYRDGWAAASAANPPPPPAVAEHVLIQYRDGATSDLPALSAAERAWCVSEAAFTSEGHYRAPELEAMTDSELAGVVLAAWHMYVQSHF